MTSRRLLGLRAFRAGGGWLWRVMSTNRWWRDTAVVQVDPSPKGSRCPMQPQRLLALVGPPNTPVRRWKGMSTTQRRQAKRRARIHSMRLSA